MRIATVWITLTLLALAALMAGCQADPQETRAWWEQKIERSESIQADLAGQVELLRASLAGVADQLAAAPPGNPTVERLEREARAGEEVLGQLLEKRDAIAAEIARSRQTLAGIPPDAGSAEINAKMGGQAVASVGAVLPPPYNAVLIGVGTLIGASGGLFGFLGKRRAERAEAYAAETDEVLLSTVAAIETAKRTSAKLREGFAESSGVIRTNLSTAAEVKVNQARQALGKAA